MFARKLLVVTALGSITLLAVAGCFMGPTPASRTGNQGGSTPVSLGVKLLNIQQGTAGLTSLNPDDLQLMADLAEDISGIEIPDVSDELAAAAVAIIEANNLNSFEDLAALEGTDPEDIIIPEDVQEVLIEEVQALLGDIGDPNLADGIIARHAPEAV